MSKHDLEEALRLVRLQLAEARSERDHYKLQRDELTRAILEDRATRASTQEGGAS